MWTRFQLQNTQTTFFWKYLFVKMVVQNCTHKPRGLLKIGNHLKTITKIEMISPSKDDKNISYSRNDIHYTMKLMEVFHQH
jgi:hypothetical protein